MTMNKIIIWLFIILAIWTYFPSRMKKQIKVSSTRGRRFVGKMSKSYNKRFRLRQSVKKISNSSKKKNILKF